MMKRVCFYLFSALLIIFISSCSSTRSMKKGVSIGNLSESEYMEELISRSPGWDAITAKMSLAVDLNGKGPTKVNGTLRMKRDEVIQLSIAPFLGIEVARAEISPDGVLVMDRMNKRYVQVPKSTKGRRLANNLHRTFDRKYDKHQPNRGFRGTVSERNLYVLRNTTPVAVFLELGNIRNKRDQQRLVLKNNRQALANWIAEGIVKDYKQGK